MDLFDHTQIIKRWIASCETTEQLMLLKEIIAEFVSKRFAGKVKDYDLAVAETELKEALIYRQSIITTGFKIIKT